LVRSDELDEERDESCLARVSVRRPHRDDLDLPGSGLGGPPILLSRVLLEQPEEPEALVAVEIEACRTRARS